jgi:hypothetical protein
MPKNTKRTFEYAGRTDEDVSRRAKQSSARYESIFNKEVPYFTARAGENCVRIMPWIFKDDPDWAELTATAKWDNHWGISVMIHRNVGPDKGTVLCLDKMLGEPCPVCDVFHAEEAEELKLSDRVLVWVIDRNNEKAGPQLWNMPLGTSKDISLASELRGGKGALLIDNPDEGHDVYFDREGEKDRTRYKQFEVVKEPSYLCEDEDKQYAWLDYVAENRLPDLLKFQEPEYLDKLLSGQIEKPDEDEGTERGSERGGRSRRPSRNDPDPDEPAARPSRRGRGDPDPDAGDTESFSRPSRSRGGRGEPGSEPRSGRSRGGRSDPGPETTSRGGRGGAAEPDTGGEPDGGAEDTGERETAPRTRGGRAGTGRAGTGRGGTVERRRATKVEDDDIPFDDRAEVEAARGRLRSVGSRRSR